MSASIASVCSPVSETKKTMKEGIRTKGKLVKILFMDFLSLMQYVNFIDT